MATSFSSIIKQAAIRINGITGATNVLLESAYATDPITAAQIDSADFSLSVLKDTLLLVEEKLVTAAAKNTNHPWRRSILSQTANVANRGLVPSVDSSGNKVVGVLGDVFDSTDNEICEPLDLDDVRIAVRNANSWLVTPIYGYAMVGDRIEHTRTNVKLDVCTYNRTARATAIATLTNPILLPDDAEEAYVCGMVSMLVRDDAFMAQAQVYRSYFNDALAGVLPARMAA